MKRAKLKTCPTCGSNEIKRVNQDVEIRVGHLHFVAPQVEFDHCPSCGEQLFDLAAMNKINASRPAVARSKTRKRKIA